MNKLILGAAALLFLMSRKASGSPQAASSPSPAPGLMPGENALPSNSPDSEAALYDSLMPGTVPDVEHLAPVTVNSPVTPVPPSSPGVVVPDLHAALRDNAPLVDAWTCPDGQVPNPMAVDFARRYAGQKIRPMIAFQRCLDSSQAALDQGNTVPPIKVTPILPGGVPGQDGLMIQKPINSITVCTWHDGQRQCVY